MSASIRLAGEDDAEGIAAIYAPIVRDTAISFEIEPPSGDDFRRRIRETMAVYPWLVGARDGLVLGYAYASAHRPRAAYRWSVDATVYIHADARGRGLGRALYTALFEIVRAQGFCNAYAGITLPNAGSVALHESMGFAPLTVYRGVGYKLGAWHDVGWWELALQPRPPAPPEPRPFVDLGGDAVVQVALARATASFAG